MVTVCCARWNYQAVGLHLRDDAKFGTFDKRNDVAHLWTIGHLILDLVDGIEN